MSQFYFGGSDNSEPSDDDLPYPTPLTRASFLTPDFNPASYLATLHNRHQTLEDLRAELRERSQTLSKELLDLVNDNYNDFLSLGASLKGGEEKVEEVRVGLLGFRRDVETVRKQVADRQHEVIRLVEERRELRRTISLGRALLMVASRIEDLELRLMVGSDGKRDVDDGAAQLDSSESEDSEGDESSSSNLISVNRLQKLIQQYLLIRSLISKTGPEHPFLVTQEPRMIRIRNTLLLDLSTALKQARSSDLAGRDRTLRVMGLYRDMGEAREAIQALKQT